MSLDDKLIKIMDLGFKRYKGTKPNGAEYADQVQGLVTQIKQAFIDEGYIDLKTTTVNGERWRSGKDWYERFEKYWVNDKLILNLPFDSPEDMAKKINDRVLKAGKKASGLK